MSTKKYIEIWLAEYGKMKKTQMVIQASRDGVNVTDDNEALETALDILEKSGIAFGVHTRRMWK